MTHNNPFTHSYRRQAKLLAPDYCKAVNRLAEVLKALKVENNIDAVAEHSDLLTPYINRVEAEWNRLNATQQKAVRRAYRKY